MIKNREAQRKKMIKEKLKNASLEVVRMETLNELDNKQMSRYRRMSIERRVMKNEAVTQFGGHVVAKEAK